MWQALLTVVIALPAALDRQLQRDAGISNFEYGVLARLSMADEVTMRLSDPARDCDSTQPRLSKAMDRFEARDWVVRRPDPGDGRYAQVKRLVFDPLGTAQRRHLGAALTRIAATVRAELEGG
ncbi:MarR family winged helix-turn-helix transcriptional regulator [Embleya sp. NPDC020630]|uniref:MarR family winged helix-turn-helix transcriptional regulator n=1 Tax=Embleya sp. NPDC020630 TaxID=3363979 RepID=UPI0037BB49E3